MPSPPTSLLRSTDFLKLWAGETVSVLGSQITQLAMPLIAIDVLHATTLQVGLLQAVEMSPFILVSLQAGVIVDRMRRRPVLILTDLLRFAALLTIPIAHHFDVLSLPQIFVVVFVTGVLTVFFDVAYQAYLPSLVPRDQLADGNGKLQMSESGAQIAGPSIAGALIQAFGASTAMIADACSFVVSALAVLGIRRAEPEVPAHDPVEGRPPTMRSQVRAGIGFVVGNVYLRNIAICTSTCNLGNSMMAAVLVVFLRRELDLSPGVIGLMFAAGNIGFLVGAALCTRVTRRLKLGNTIVAAILCSTAGPFLIAAAPDAGPLPWLIAGQVLLSVSLPLYNINQVSFRQAITPHEMQGRMNATMRFFVWGSMPIGLVAGGVLGTVIGLRETLWVAALLGIIPIAPVALTPVRKLVDIPPPVDADPPTASVISEPIPGGPAIETPTGD